MKYKNWQILTGIALIALSALLYLAQVKIFRSTRDTFFYLLQDLAFVPIQVLLVTLILSKILSVREKRIMLKKLNMIIGVFFTDAGIDLLKKIHKIDSRSEKIREQLIVSDRWSEKEFYNVRRVFKEYDCKIEAKASDFEDLRYFLGSEKDFLLALLENPNLLEHESFTELLWAVFHLTEELIRRQDFKDIPHPDHAHLENDIKRTYLLLLIEWLSYMEHLKNDYPYLFSFAMRTNPFDPDASPIIKG